MPHTPFIIVTGASRGIGRETVRALIREHGAEVLALARDEAALSGIQKEFGRPRLGILTLDITLADAPSRVVEATGGRDVHGLVHNAGSLSRTPLGNYTEQGLQQLFAVNVFAPLLLTQALLKQLTGEPPGHVVHLASMGGFQDSMKFAGLAGYSASKAALACLSQCLAEETKGMGVHNNCLALGAVDTEMFATAFPGFTAPTSATEMGRFVARFVLEGHKLFNGKVLPVATSTP